MSTDDDTELREAAEHIVLYYHANADGIALIDEYIRPLLAKRDAEIAELKEKNLRLQQIAADQIDMMTEAREQLAAARKDSELLETVETKKMNLMYGHAGNPDITGFHWTAYVAGTGTGEAWHAKSLRDTIAAARDAETE